jgi:hypothetical protein
MSKWTRLLAEVAHTERYITFLLCEAVHWERAGENYTAMIYRQGAVSQTSHLERLKQEKERLLCLVDESMDAAKTGFLIEDSVSSDAKMAPTYSST